MKFKFLLALALFVHGILWIGCVKAPGPVLSIDRAMLKEVRSINVEQVVNATSQKEITPLVERSLETELKQLKNYKITEGDASISCVITEYIPLKSELVKSGKDVDYKMSDYTETKREIKKGHGCLWGAIVDVLIPSHRVKGGEEYKYRTIIQSPLINIDLTLSKEGQVIYKGSKFISEESRIPDCYSATYRGILPKERMNSIDFIVGLAIKELLEPLK